MLEQDERDNFSFCVQFCGIILSIFVIWTAALPYLAQFAAPGSPTIVRGNGPHLVVMIHGFMDAPPSMVNLANLFDEKNFTVLISGAGSGYRTYWSMNRLAHLHWNEILEYMKPHHTRINFIGNSQGGCIAKRVATRLQHWIIQNYRDCSSTESMTCISVTSTNSRDVANVIWDSPIQLVNFITLATPHLGFRNHGISSVTSHNKFRFAMVLNDLRFIFYKLVVQLNEDFLNEDFTDNYYLAFNHYQRRIAYSVNSFDLNVPLQSTEIGMSSVIKRSETNITSLCNVVTHRLPNHNTFFSGWTFNNVPIGSYLAHGALSGKHLDSIWTYDRESVAKSIQHIRAQFG